MDEVRFKKKTQIQETKQLFTNKSLGNLLAWASAVKAIYIFGCYMAVAHIQRSFIQSAFFNSWSEKHWVHLKEAVRYHIFSTDIWKLKDASLTLSISSCWPGSYPLMRPNSFCLKFPQHWEIEVSICCNSTFCLLERERERKKQHLYFQVSGYLCVPGSQKFGDGFLYEQVFVILITAEGSHSSSYFYFPTLQRVRAR